MIQQAFFNHRWFPFSFYLSWCFIIFFLFFPTAALSAKCLYISSYHSNYQWDMGIRRGLEPLLASSCELKTFFMDTKRNKSEKFAKTKAIQALILIKNYQPDVIIAADDNASLYLVVPYLVNTEIPVVFCGINNSAEPYGYPYKNVTGMVEVTPIQPILRAIKETLASVKQGVFLSADVLSQRRMFERLKKSFQQNNIQIEGIFVTTQDEWEQSWIKAQNKDFIFIGNPVGIEQWDNARALHFAVENTQILSLTSWKWLSPLAMLTITKIPEEQGEWSAKVTLEILKGTDPEKIPVVVNRQWKMYRNSRLLNASTTKLPIGIIHNAQEAIP